MSRPVSVSSTVRVARFHVVVSVQYGPRMAHPSMGMLLDGWMDFNQGKLVRIGLTQSVFRDRMAVGESMVLGRLNYFHQGPGRSIVYS